MSARKYRHEDGTGRKRIARTTEPMDLWEALQWLTRQVGDDGYEAMVPRGTEVEWYSAATPEEVAAEAAITKQTTERNEQWERETYARLKAKFEPEESR